MDLFVIKRESNPDPYDGPGNRRIVCGKGSEILKNVTLNDAELRERAISDTEEIFQRPGTFPNIQRYAAIGGNLTDVAPDLDIRSAGAAGQDVLLDILRE